jgi:hypothetical protein
MDKKRISCEKMWIKNFNLDFTHTLNTVYTDLSTVFTKEKSLFF